MTNSDLCDALKTAMTEIDFTGLTGENIKWTADGEPNKEPSVLQVSNGAYVAVE